MDESSVGQDAREVLRISSIKIINHLPHDLSLEPTFYPFP